jgi:hypothetical protein
MRIVWTVVVVAALGCACGNAKATVSTRAAALSAAPAGATILLERLQMQVDRVRLTPVTSQTSGVGGEQEVGAGPFELDLTEDELTGTVSHAFDISAPPGDYARVTARVHADANHPDSIAIEGRFNGYGFRFASGLNEDQEREAPLTVGELGTTNVTFSFDTSRWFSDGQGGALDPSNSSNRSQIENNIKASLEAFEDDDRDGVADHTR